MTTSTGITFLSARPGNLLIRVGHAEKSDGYISAFRDIVESLCLLGITRIRALKHGLHLSYDVRIVEANDLKDMLTAADSTVRFARGRHSPSTHSLSVTFDGPASFDLPVASLMLGTTETGLIRRLCRTAHIVAGLASAAAAPVIEVTFSSVVSPGLQACRSRKAVLPGTLLLSDAGITIAAQGCFSNELQIGRLSPPEGSQPGRLHVGDFVRFQQKPHHIACP
jgi:allophanate hydrolase subunit 1